ncbi:MAG TPA: hypothetical protein VMW17_09530 [Candidatus Binatia bacterium]|nr:hypothetical protein [Candidatus Binatia bacterium]
MERLKRFFSTIVQRAFWELGLTEQPIVNHVSGVLTAFADAEQLYRLRSIEGKRVDSLIAMMLELPDATPRAQIERERALRCYLGDYALFMSGIFRSHAERGGYLDYYFDTGRRSYWAVSELDVTLYRTGFLLFQELSKKFDVYSGALDYVRKAYFAPSPGSDPFAGFLKQVDGWVRTGISNN